jgi:dolichol-phosphate mannosyltransferase
MGSLRVRCMRLPNMHKTMPKRISVVAPLYNEKDGIAMLAQTLSQLAAQLAPERELECVLVDDGSRDGTTDEAKKQFAAWPRIVHVKHERNRGVGAAVRSGFAAATGDVICTIDSDCTFDPLQIPQLLELMDREKADIATASPYHPQGGVENVPPWRLLLSHGASMVYRRVCASKLYSYTALMRAYRRKVVETVEFSSNGFSATTEVLLRAAHRGYKVVELPMVLKSRVIGVSKMKVIDTIRMHLGLMSQALWWRVADRKAAVALGKHQRQAQ